MDNDYVQPLLTLGPFGGIDATTSPYYVAETNFVDSLNVVPNEFYGGYTTALGRVAKGSLPNTPTGAHKFIRNGVDTYVFAVGTGLYAGPLGGPYNALSLPAPLTSGKTTYFADALQWVFLTNGTDTPLKIRVSDLSVTYWGIVAPTTAPTLIVAGTSTMSGTYYYCVTFGNSSQESSQGTVSNPITVSNTGVALTSIPVSSDPQVTQRNIYRINTSSGMGQWRLVATINDNTTTTYTDTLPDSQVTGQQLIVFRDPPQVFSFIAAHKERIFGFGTPTDPSIVYWSNLNEPWGFNEETGNRPVGENSFSDVASGISSIGSVLCLHKSRTYYQIYGQTDADFQVVKIADTGTIAPLSVASQDGLEAFLNRRGVWLNQGQGPQIISDGGYKQSNIKDFIRSLTDNDLASAVGFWYDRMYHISFPTLNLTYFYDLRTEGWYKLGWATSCVYFNAEDANPVVAANLQTPGQVDAWFAAENDLGQPTQTYVISRISDSGDSSTEKIYRYIELLAPPQSGLAHVYLIANPGNQQYEDNYPINLNTGTTRKQQGVSDKIRGVEIQVKVQTYSNTQLTIQKVTIYGYTDRRLIEQSNAAASQ